MNTSLKVLLEASDQALRPLEDSIKKEYCKVYGIDESEIAIPINLYNLVGLLLSIIEETEEVGRIL